MIVMPANNTGHIVRDLDRDFPGQLAHLYAPSEDTTGWRAPFMDYAIDNGAFSAQLRGQDYPHGRLLGLLDRAEALELEHGVRPLWLACPDVPYRAGPTLDLWRGLAPWWRALFAYPLALVVQDEMEPADVRALHEQPDLIFVGGSTAWKWRTVGEWCAAFPRVHVGKVNGYGLLWKAAEAGAESCDGTGWCQGDRQQLAGLRRFLTAWRAGSRSHPQTALFKEAS